MLLLQTLCFHKSLFTSTTLHQWGTSVCMPCPAHIATFSSCESHHQSQTSHCKFHHSEILISRNLRMLHWDCRTDGVIQSNHILWWLSKSTNMCAAWQCHDEVRFLLDSGEAEFIWKFSQCSDVCIRVDCLQFKHHNHKNHTFTVPEDSDHDLTQWQRLFQFFSLGEWGWSHSMDWFSEPSPWGIQVSSVVTV